MSIGQTLPLWSCLPFVGMLLSIAIFPLAKPEWWEKRQLHVSLFWALLFFVPFVFAYGGHLAFEELANVILLDYVEFIVLLLGLFTVAGGIHIRGVVPGTTRNNVIMLALGTALASWIGTTGAAMLLIRPLLRANSWRKNKTHVVVFFIFLVANIGGCLTPLGDPPLFLGYLRHVPFFWTLEHIWPLLLLNSALLLAIFAIVDHRMVLREGKDGEDALDLQRRAAARIPFGLEGKRNLIFLAMIIIAVIVNGSIAQSPDFIDPATGKIYGITVIGEVHLGVNWFIEVLGILAATFLSLHFTPKQVRSDNEFEWEPIAEVARLFIGIFITMIPALAILATNGGDLGIDSPLKFFWATGLLSSFLDNSPTYVVFLTTAGAMGSDAVGAVATSVGTVDPAFLLAISAGSVFMGALTYIGNAPNFMVKAIAEGNGVKMPSFFGYMKWSLGFLIPVFIVNSLLFFL